MLLTTLLYIVFVLAAFVLIVVILLQEGKGGGFGDALGMAGQQTFGVKAQGIHKFTAGLAVVFLASAICIHLLNKRATTSGTLGSGGAGTLDVPTSPADGSDFPK